MVLGKYILYFFLFTCFLDQTIQLENANLIDVNIYNNSQLHSRPENEYDRVKDEEWISLSAERRCQLIIDKLDHDTLVTSEYARLNLIIYSLLRPIPVEDNGICLKRLIIWHYEKVELIKSNPKIKNYEDILPVRLLLLGMSPNQHPKESRNLAEIPNFLNIACKHLLSQKPRVRWPLNAARNHPYIAEIFGFQKLWIYSTTEVLSACAQHIFQTSNGYIISILVSAEQLVDETTFYDLKNAWKDRIKGSIEQVRIDMDMEENKVKNKTLRANVIKHDPQEKDIPKEVRHYGKLEIEEIPMKIPTEIRFSPLKLPVPELPTSVSSEICSEVQTKEIPGMSKYNLFPGFSSPETFSSIIVPSEYPYENPHLTPIHPDDRGNVNFKVYRNFWKTPYLTETEKHLGKNTLDKYIIKKSGISWPNIKEDALKWESNILSRQFPPKIEVYEVPKMMEQRKLVYPYEIDETGILSHYNYVSDQDIDNTYKYDKYAYYDDEELERQSKKYSDPSSYLLKEPLVIAEDQSTQNIPILKYEGLVGKRFINPLLTIKRDVNAKDNVLDEDDETIYLEMKFREVARRAMINWFYDQKPEGYRINGKDRVVLKRIFQCIDKIDPVRHEELLTFGDNEIVKAVLKKYNNNRIINRKPSKEIEKNLVTSSKKRPYKVNVLKSRNRNRHETHEDTEEFPSQVLEEEIITFVPSGKKSHYLAKDKYNFSNLLKEERLKRFHKLLRKNIESRLKEIESKDNKKIVNNEIERLKKLLDDERKYREKLESEYKNNLEEHAKIMDILKNNQEKIRNKMKDENEKEKARLRGEMNQSMEQMEVALNVASSTIGDLEKQNEFLNNKLKNLDEENKMIRMMINMRDNYMKELEKNHFEAETKQQKQLNEMKSIYEKQLKDLKNNIENNDPITGFKNMVENLEVEAQTQLNRIDDTQMNENKIKEVINHRIREREKQLELAYQRQKRRDVEYLGYILQLLEQKGTMNAERVANELKDRIIQLEDKQEELQNTREEIEIVNNDLIQQVEQQHEKIKELMKQVEDMKIQHNTAHEELKLAKIKLNDIEDVEKILKKKMENIKSSGAPSDEILEYLKKALSVAEKEKKTAKKDVENARIGYDQSEVGMQTAIKDLENARDIYEKNKSFEKQLNEEREEKLKKRKERLQRAKEVGVSQANSDLLKCDITPLLDHELEELNRLRQLGLEELSDTDRINLISLGQRQLATREVSFEASLASINSKVTKELDEKEIESVSTLWEDAAEASINSIELENSKSDIVLRKLEEQDRSIKAMKDILLETQGTIEELNKQLILHRELSNSEKEPIQIYNEKKGVGVFEESMIPENTPYPIHTQKISYMDSISPKEQTPLVEPDTIKSEMTLGSEVSEKEHTSELNNKGRSYEDTSELSQSQDFSENSRLLIEELLEKTKRAKEDGPLSVLNRRESSYTPVIKHSISAPNVNPKETLVANTIYEDTINSHKQKEGPVERNVYILHDVQIPRPPSSSIKCEGIVKSFQRSLKQFLDNFQSNGKKFEVLSRTVLPGLQYDECYNSTISIFETYEEKLSKKGAHTRVVVLLTDFLDSGVVSLGDFRGAGYIQSKIPYIVQNMLGALKYNSGSTSMVEKIINNFPSEWIHEHIKTCKELLSGKSILSISKSGLSPTSTTGRSDSISIPLQEALFELTDIPPIILANLEVVPRPDREPCVRTMRRMKQRLGEVKGLLNSQSELKLKHKLKFQDPQTKLFIFTLEDTIPYEISEVTQNIVPYCEKYIEELFIKMSNMRWIAIPKSNPLVRIMVIPTTNNPALQNDNIDVTLWKKKALKLAFAHKDILDNWTGTTLTKHLTAEDLSAKTFMSDERARELIIQLLDTLNLKDPEDIKFLEDNGWGIIDDKSDGKFTRRPVEGILFIVRSSDVIPPGTEIDPRFLSMDPDESPYILEHVIKKYNTVSESTESSE
ncbi:hypothetical protein cand_016260 [Cryptosporidium andersoni]|uniref:Uncharacterized protein n=1 Tax=Cryptosporidium andersoni TaxID=117008 RepID=A0A1J4MT99_9CRYT|nr:hypothetical protein cand_016260 [Cryptosporidium andersoni]